MLGLIALVALFVELVLARVLGKAGYGVYVYVITILTFVTILARAGIDSAIVRFLPEYAVQQRWDRMNGLLKFAQGFSLIMSALAILIIVAIINFWGVRQELAQTFFTAIWLIPGMALGSVYQAATRTFRMVILPQVILHVMPSLLLATTALAANEFLAKELFAPDAALYKSTFTLIAMLILLQVYRKARPVAISQSRPVYLPGKWIGTGIVIFSIMIMMQVINHTGTLLLGSMIDTDTAGIYNAANKISLLASFPLMAVNMISAPLITEMHTSGRREQFQRLLREITVITFAGTFVIVAVLLIFGKWFLGLFGEGFVIAYIPLCILLIGQIFIAISGPTFAVMAQTGLHRPASIVMACTAILNLVLNLILIPDFGMHGAAAASTCSVVIQRLVISVYMRRYTDFNTSLFRLKDRSN